MDEIIFMLLFFYWHCVKRRNNFRRLISSYIENSERLNYTPQSHNPIVAQILAYDETQTRKHLRISSSSFREIATFLPRKTHGWIPEIELMAFLFWLASGTSHRMVGALMGIPRTTITEIIHKLLNFTVDHIMPQVIKFPKTNELRNVGLQFSRRAGSSVFKNVVGAIDGTHISILCPVHLHDQYINRKLDYSIQCQAICDANLQFLDVFIGYPGSVHDTRVLYNSPVFIKKLYPPPPFIILGDSGYPCRLEPIRIITPYKRNHRISPEQLRFNLKHAKARNTVERAFGQLKVRWRNIFRKSLELKIVNCVKTVAACCTFHNICIKTKDSMPLELTLDENAIESPETQIEENQGRNDQTTALQYRNEMVDQLI